MGMLETVENLPTLETVGNLLKLDTVEKLRVLLKTVEKSLDLMEWKLHKLQERMSSSGSSKPNLPFAEGPRRKSKSAKSKSAQPSASPFQMVDFTTSATADDLFKG